MAAPQPETIGKFRIVEKLGQGGMGTVYRAVHGTLERPVALKILPPEFSNHSEYVMRFLREARTSATIQHQNVVQVYDAGEQDGRYYIAMEFIDGAHLLKYVEDRGKVNEAEGIDLLLQAAKGLAAAHAKGLVHRDIKPENMLVGKDNILRIVDFGLVMESASSTQLTATGACLGTPMYMSPEQADGEQADARTDIYSLGVSFFRVFTGHPAFSSPTVMNLLFKHKFEAPPNPRALRTDLSENISNLLLHMMTKRRELRPKDGQALVEMIETVQRGGKVPAPPPFEPTPTAVGMQLMAQPASQPQGNSRNFIAYAVAAVALLFVVVLLMRGRPKPDYAQAADAQGNPKTSASAESPAELAAKGDSAFAAEHYAQALKFYRQAAKQAPQDNELNAKLDKTQKTLRAQELLHAAETLENDGQLDLAQQRYAEAAQLDGTAAASLARERSQRIKAQLEKTERPAGQEKTRERDEVTSKATDAEREGHYEEAAQYFSRAALLSEPPLRTTYAEKAIDCRRQDYIARAVAAENEGNFTAAKQNYTKALAIKPDDPLIAQKLDSVQRRMSEGGANAEQQQYSKAMKDGQDALERGDYKEARVKFGIAIGMKRGAEAGEKLKELEGREYLQRADDARDAGNHTAAKDLYQRAEQASPKLNGVVRTRIAALHTSAPANSVVIQKVESLVRNDKDNDALAEVGKALHTDPGNRELKNVKQALENLIAAVNINEELLKIGGSAKERLADAQDIDEDERYREYKKAVSSFSDKAEERSKKIRPLFLGRDYEMVQSSLSAGRNDAADLGTELGTYADTLDRKAGKASEKIGVKVPFINVGVGGDKRKSERYRRLSESLRQLADQAKALRR